MEGKEFLIVAQKLVQMRSEAAIRSAVSRAYYSAFITGRKLLFELGFSLQIDASAHEQVYRLLHNAGIPIIKDIAASLKNLRLRRVQADYEMANRDFQSHLEGEVNIAHAKLIIAQLESCYQQPLHNRLKAGIQEYKRKIKLHS
ncbi:MAG: hypothetical protein ONB46_08210 [candidate division KSB1 bacterium]|nr:hypothetical protein [candidate division KSB1 bacterium]MDZ7365746.1 hypothetical protein [candidate division KSB1 bacterium]MDZ7403774.1 hypothetical protein [candidate division KSB1 bacterium]